MRFLLGFGTALFGSLAVYFALIRPSAPAAPCAGKCGPGTRCESERCLPTGAAPEPAAKAEPRRARRRRPLRPGDRGASRPPRGDSLLPQDMDLGAQVVDMERGGEAQLSTAVIEATVGRNFGAIRRCILVAQAERESPVRGRMPIGIRIRPSGEVAAVAVRPPGPLAGTDLGPCVRSAVARIRFPRFNGREMAVTYPVTLE